MITLGDKVTYRDPFTGKNRRGVKVVRLDDYVGMFGPPMLKAVAVLSDGNRKFVCTLHKVKGK